MLNSLSKHLIPLALCTAILTVTGCEDGVDLPTETDPQEARVLAGPPTFPGGEPLKVLSRNMYMGGNTGLIFAADLNDPIAVFQAAAMVWGQIQATNFPERSRALVDEIQEANPHLVAIQEIPHFLILDGGFNPTGAIDHLDILKAEIEARGLPYRVEAVQANTVAVMPTGLDFTTYQVTQWIRYTDRIAVLVRDDLPVTDVDQANYQASYALSPDLELKRGWIRVSAKVDGLDYHFVTTHLEVQDFASIQKAQLQELLGPIMSDLGGVTVLAGDLNSDAAAEPGATSWTPTYGALIDEGFQDAWLLAHPGRASDGLTCCQAKTLDNSPSSLEERIDFVLLRSNRHRGKKNRIPGMIQVERVGEALEDRTSPTGLWPSDHAGLLASLKIPSHPFEGY